MLLFCVVGWPCGGDGSGEYDGDPGSVPVTAWAAEQAVAEQAAAEQAAQSGIDGLNNVLTADGQDPVDAVVLSELLFGNVPKPPPNRSVELPDELTSTA